MFRKEGDYWTVGYGGKSVPLKDARGFEYLVHLLRHPRVEFHALDLFGGIASRREVYEPSQSLRVLAGGTEDLERAGFHVTRSGDAGEMLDEQAKTTYKRRLFELHGELEEAKQLGRVQHAQEVEGEIDALTRELSRAVGLRGRNRRAGSASERARQSITKSIRLVLERIAQSDSTLGGILSRSVKTGTFCSYRPDLVSAIAWEFGTTDAGSTIEPAKPQAATGVPTSSPANHPNAPPLVLQVSPFSMAERTAFVGRESEGTAIRTAINHALAARGSTVMLWGGPGVGKTRLAMEMVEYASSIGFRCSVGRCYERDEPCPYIPFAEIIESNLAQAASLDDYRRQIGPNAAEIAQIAPSLRRVFPDLPKPLELPPAQQRRYLFQSFSEALARAARARPYMYLLEDLHWADESTLALLIHLANRVSQLPVVIVGTYRSGYSDDNPALVRSLEELVRMGVRPQRLNGLSRDAVAQMLRGLSQRDAPENLINLIFEESQGYPLFVEEVYRHLIEEGKVFDAVGQFRADLNLDESDVPENVRLIISRRLERLDANEKVTLAAAAVIGRSFSFRLLTAVSHVDVDDLFSVIEKAQRMGIIVPSSEGPEKPFTFSHELVRQTLLADISTPRQQQLHARVADAIEQLYPGAVNEHAGEIADHTLKAGSFAGRQRLVHWLTLAGKRALESAAFQEAQRNFRSALASQDAINPADKAELLSSLAIAYRGLGQWDAEIANRREALEICVNLGDLGRIGSSVIELTEALWWAGRHEEATDAARRGLAYLPADVSADRVRLLAALARILGHTESYEAASEVLREASVAAAQLSDPGLKATLLIARSSLNLQFLRLREALVDALSSQRSGESALLRNEQLLVMLQAELHFGHMDEVQRLSEEIESLAKKVGPSATVGICRRFMAWAEFGRAPDLTRYQADLGQVLQLERTLLSYGGVVSEACLCLLDFLRGEWPDALAHAETAYRLEASVGVKGIAAGMLFLQRAYAGQRDGAFAVFNEKQEWLPRPGHHNRSASWFMLATMVEGLVILGERSQAGKLYPLVRELLGTSAVVLWLSHFTQTIAGIAAAAARHWEVAETHFQIALQQAESFPYRLEQAEVRRFHSMMLLDRAATGDREKAQPLLNQALEIYARIGMPRHIEMTQSLLDRAAVG